MVIKYVGPQHSLLVLYADSHIQFVLSIPSSVITLALSRIRMLTTELQLELSARTYGGTNRLQQLGLSEAVYPSGFWTLRL